MFTYLLLFFFIKSLNIFNNFFMTNKQEIILLSAIHLDDNTAHPCQPINISSGIVVLGRRHYNCYYLIDNCLSTYWKQFKSLERKGEEGFLTSHNRFVNRREAFKIAKSQNQILLYEKQIFTGFTAKSSISSTLKALETTFSLEKDLSILDKS